MCRINKGLIIFSPITLLSFFLNAQAFEKLPLSCNIVFNNFGGIKSNAISKDVELVNFGQKSAKVGKIDKYEFQVHIYSTQVINGYNLINSFEVTILNRENNISMSALSDSIFTPGDFPHHGRIVLKNEQNNNSNEESYLLFECLHLD